MITAIERAAPPAPAPASPADVARRTQLPYADFFRALAIFYVFIGHVGGFAHEPHLFHHIALSDAGALFDGVAMLFCLSGFLLAAPLLRAYLDTPGDMPLLRPYLLARFLRIYPLYAAAVILISLALAAIGRAPSWTDIVLHLAMLQNFSPTTIQSLAGPLWTMPLDAQFYLLLPLGFGIAAAALGRYDRRTRIVGLYAALAVTVALSIAYRFAVVRAWAPAGLDEQLFIVDQFPGMASLFALGIAARLTVELLARARLTIRPSALAGAAILFAVVARGTQYLAHAEWLHATAVGWHGKAAVFAAFDQTFAGLGCAALLIAADYARGGWFGRFVATPAVAYAAAIAYAFYLFHYTLLDALSARLHVHGAGGMLLLIGAALVVLIPLCALAHRAIEQPFLRRKARLQRVRETT